MIYDQEVLTAPTLLRQSESSLPLESVRHSIGLQNLHRAFREPRPLVILTGRSNTDLHQLISSFLDGIDSNVTVLRIGKACTDPLEGMREVVQSTGFEPQNMDLVELEIMFMKFLSLQRFQDQRTIFLIDETPGNNDWVRDKVRNLVELEKAGNFGLMVILSRQSDLDEEIDIPVLEVDTSLAKNGRTKNMRKLFPSVPAAAAPKKTNGSRQHELTVNSDNDDTVPLNIILTHHGKGVHELTLEQPRLMIGRAEDNDLCINNTNVSRHHAILVRHGAAALLMDMNSKNGTFVNSQRIKDQVVVHNDIITIGSHEIKFVAPSAMHSSAQD